MLKHQAKLDNEKLMKKALIELLLAEKLFQNHYKLFPLALFNVHVVHFIT